MTTHERAEKMVDAHSKTWMHGGEFGTVESGMCVTFDELRIAAHRLRSEAVRLQAALLEKEGK